MGGQQRSRWQRLRIVGAQAAILGEAVWRRDLVGKGVVVRKRLDPCRSDHEIQRRAQGQRDGQRDQHPKRGQLAEGQRVGDRLNIEKRALIAAVQARKADGGQRGDGGVEEGLAVGEVDLPRGLPRPAGPQRHDHQSDQAHAEAECQKSDPEAFHGLPFAKTARRWGGPSCCAGPSSLAGAARAS